MENIIEAISQSIKRVPDISTVEELRTVINYSTSYPIFDITEDEEEYNDAVRQMFGSKAYTNPVGSMCATVGGGIYQVRVFATYTDAGSVDYVYSYTIKEW